MDRFLRWQSLRQILPFGLILLSPEIAHAHVGVGPADGLAAGLAHPFHGLDHLCVMIAVGLWAAQRGGRSIWLLPLAFVTVMAAGGVLGMLAISIPFVEPGILASLLVLGVLVAAAMPLPLVASVLLIGVFALFHGHAHATEMPASASGLAYGIGLILSAALLQLCGIGLGVSAQRIGRVHLMRYLGSAIVAAGLYLAFV